jgi:hypothetical protein
VHILESYLIAINASKPVFELGDSIGPVIFLDTFASQVLDGDCVRKLILLVAERRWGDRFWWDLSKEIFVFREVKWVKFGKIVTYGSIGVDHHSHLDLLTDFFELFGT